MLLSTQAAAESLALAGDPDFADPIYFSDASISPKPGSEPFDQFLESVTGEGDDSEQEPSDPYDRHFNQYNVDALDEMTPDKEPNPFGFECEESDEEHAQPIITLRYDELTGDGTVSISNEDGELIYQGAFGGGSPGLSGGSGPSGNPPTGGLPGGGGGPPTYPPGGGPPTSPPPGGIVHLPKDPPAYAIPSPTAMTAGLVGLGALAMRRRR